jgi:hypothetical protein
VRADGRDVHEVRGPPLGGGAHQIRGEGPDHPQHPGDIGVDHPLPLVDAPVVDRVREHDTRRVHHQVDSPVGGMDPLDGRVHRTLVGHIGDHGERLPAIGPDLLDDGVQPLLTPRQQRDPRTLRRQQYGDGLTDPARGPGDDGGTAGQILVRHGGAPQWPEVRRAPPATTTTLRRPVRRTQG